MSETLIKRGAALGANSTIRCGVTIGEWAMVGSGSVITRDVPAYGLVMGNPARLKGFVDPCGDKLIEKEMPNSGVSLQCPKCGFATIIAQENYAIFFNKELER